jgi:uncharacterized protein YcbX
MTTVGTVAELWRFPVKSMQGERLESARIDDRGIEGDRRWALIDLATGKLMTAKRWSKLLLAAAHTDESGAVTIDLGDGAPLSADDPDASARLSAWLGRDIVLQEAAADTAVAYEMTLDPPNDDAEYFDIPAPPGSFFDWADIHLLTEPTFAAAARSRPELQWDIRRFRPNIIVAGDLEPFAEDGWSGSEVEVGDDNPATIAVRQPTVRCAVPLRAQPGLARQPEIFSSLQELHDNHLGVYCDVTVAGEVAVGSPVRLG